MRIEAVLLAAFYFLILSYFVCLKMREIVHLQAGQCGNQIGAKVCGAVTCLTQQVERQIAKGWFKLTPWRNEVIKTHGL